VLASRSYSSIRVSSLPIKIVIAAFCSFIYLSPSPCASYGAGSALHRHR
jgi:hypothetical protein